MKNNGEGIYDTTYWAVYGEGPTEITEGAFSDTKRAKFTSEDIRFTYKPPYIYAYVLNWDKNSVINIKSLKEYSKYFLGHIESVELLGYDNEVTFTRDADAMNIKIDGSIDTSYPICLKILID